jgi:hypothetical protein
MPLLGNVVPASGMGFERHRGYTKMWKGERLTLPRPHHHPADPCNKVALNHT